MSETFSERFPGIARACLEIALDNGGISRFRPELSQSAEFEVWMASKSPENLTSVEGWLAALSEDEMLVVCTGCQDEGEKAAILAKAPPFTDELLNSYFDEVC